MKVEEKRMEIKVLDQKMAINTPLDIMIAERNGSCGEVQGRNRITVCNSKGIS